jgi:hypothetical protein
MMTNTCGNCRHFHRQLALPMPKGGDCIAHPPAAHIIMTASPIGQPMPQAVAVFPPRPMDAPACGEWWTRSAPWSAPLADANPCGDAA